MPWKMALFVHPAMPGVLPPQSNLYSMPYGFIINHSYLHFLPQLSHFSTKRYVKPIPNVFALWPFCTSPHRSAARPPGGKTCRSPRILFSSVQPTELSEDKFCRGWSLLPLNFGWNYLILSYFVGSKSQSVDRRQLVRRRRCNCNAQNLRQGISVYSTALAF
jgi:hypothetical protein